MDKDPFFALEGTPSDIDEEKFYKLIEQHGATIRGLLYRPDNLKSKSWPFRWRVRDITFINISFSKTLIENFEFTNCTFRRCLFINTTFKDCRFTNCKFIDSNPYRVEYQSVYIDPRSFKECLDKKKHPNIGVYLFQELLRNSRQLSQPDFADDAQYRFRRWQRYQLQQEFKSAHSISARKLHKGYKIMLFLVFDITTGSGMRLTNLALSSIFILISLSFINWYFADVFGLKIGNGDIISTFSDAAYFSSVTITTLGFGDITPTTRIGRIVIGIEAILGLVLLAILASTVYRRIST